jgi:alpha-L-rhamnosidase
LSDNGYTGLAYELLLQESYPSWLYPVKMGATTIWERWDGEKTDSTFQDSGMNSFNHYAYGAIGDWMYRVSAGIEIQSPGYKHILIQPHPSDSLTYSRATFESSYGTISSGWERKDGKIKINVIIPVNTTATITLPANNQDKITESGKALPQNPFIKEVKIVDDKLTMQAGSGNYIFEYLEQK